MVIQRIADQPKVVDAAVFEFSRSFIEALVIVLAVSFLSLGWRSGIVVATSVPLVLAIVFIAMAFLGLDLQRVTLRRFDHRGSACWSTTPSSPPNGWS